MMAEAFRSTALSVRSANQESSGPQVFVVTSPQPQAGKSTTVANLAVALAEHKQKLLLVDGDLRRPELHSFFGLRRVLGLAQVLEDSTPISSCDLSQYIQSTSIPGVDILSAGSFQDTDPRLIGSRRFSELIERLKPDYDMVLIDSPPLLHLPDTRLICRAADAAVLLSRAGKTTFDEMATSVRILEEDGVRLLGTILTDWNPTIRNPSYYDSY
jgi:succinoglycan biosynthesis transport protein ExoP